MKVYKVFKKYVIVASETEYNLLTNAVANFDLVDVEDYENLSSVLKSKTTEKAEEKKDYEKTNFQPTEPEVEYTNYRTFSPIQTPSVEEIMQDYEEAEEPAKPETPEKCTIHLVGGPGIYVTSALTKNSAQKLLDHVKTQVHTKVVPYGKELWIACKVDRDLEGFYQWDTDEIGAKEDAITNIVPTHDMTITVSTIGIPDDTGGDIEPEPEGIPQYEEYENGNDSEVSFKVWDGITKVDYLYIQKDETRGFELDNMQEIEFDARENYSETIFLVKK